MKARKRKQLPAALDLNDPGLAERLKNFLLCELRAHPPGDRKKVAEVCWYATRDAYHEIADQEAEAKNRLEIGNCFRTIERAGHPDSYPIWFKVLKAEGSRVHYLSFHKRPRDGYVVIEPDWVSSDMVIRHYTPVRIQAFNKAWQRMLRHLAKVAPK